MLVPPTRIDSSTKRSSFFVLLLSIQHKTKRRVEQAQRFHHDLAHTQTQLPETKKLERLYAYAHHKNIPVAE